MEALPIPVYQDQFQEVLKEIRANRGKNVRIVGNIVYFTDQSDKNYRFVPERLENGGVMFFKREMPAHQEETATTLHNDH